VGDDVFKLGELVDLYRVAPSNPLEEISNFCIVENIFVDVDVEGLNDVLRSVETHKSRKMIAMKST
jgi:hypothetical protein